MGQFKTVESGERFIALNCIGCVNYNAGHCPAWKIHLILSKEQDDNPAIKEILDYLIPSTTIELGGKDAKAGGGFNQECRMRLTMSKAKERMRQK